MRIHIDSIRATAAAALVGGLIGCGGDQTLTVDLPKEPVYPVHGKVLLPDGKPLSEGFVRFVPVKAEARGAMGKVQPDGTFELESGGLGRGAPAGDYKVIIESPLTVAGPKGLKTFAVPQAYSESDKTPLEVSVSPSTNDMKPFELSSKPVATKKPAQSVSKAALRDHG